MKQPKKLESLKSVVSNQESILGGGVSKSPVQTGELVIIHLNGQIITYHRPEVDKITF